jgi:hypothetical protein
MRKEVLAMQSSIGSTLKAVGLAFALVVGVHFAAPPSAAAFCSCTGLSHTTPTFQAVEPTCDGAMNELNEDFVDPEGQTCGGFDACMQQTHITQACFQRTDGQWEIDGYQRYWCESGTTCP